MTESSNVSVLSLKCLVPSLDRLGHEGQFSRQPLPLFSLEGPCEEFWNGQGCPLFDVVHSAFPLSTNGIIWRLLSWKVLGQYCCPPGPLFPRSIVPHAHCSSVPIPPPSLSLSQKKQKTYKIKAQNHPDQTSRPEKWQRVYFFLFSLKKSRKSYKKKILIFVNILIWTVLNQSISETQYESFRAFFTVIITHYYRQQCSERRKDPVIRYFLCTVGWGAGDIGTGKINAREEKKEKMLIFHCDVHHHHHLPLKREGCWGTTDMILQRFLHFLLFSTALWDLPYSRPLHSLRLSSHLFLCLPCLLPPSTVPRKMVLARPDEWETWPYHCSLRLFTLRW